MNFSNTIITSDDFNFEQYLDKISKDSKDIKKSIKIEQSYCGVHVYALAVHDNYELNKTIELPTNFGLSISPEVHDNVRDLYYLEGVDIHHIGFVPVNYRITIEEADWDVCVPLPFAVVKRYISNQQKSEFFRWRSKYSDDNFRIKFVQILGMI